MSVAMKKQRSVSMSMARVTIEGHVDACGLWMPVVHGCPWSLNIWNLWMQMIICNEAAEYFPLWEERGC